MLNHTQRGLATLGIMGLLLILIYVSHSITPPTLTKATDGILDLRSADRALDATPLAGQWQIIWGEFIEPSALAANPTPTPQFITLPGVWNDKLYEGKTLPAQGTATLTLRVLLPNTDDFTLKIPPLYTSYRLWVNETLTVDNPALEDKFRQTHDVSMTHLIPIASASGEIRLTFHLANYRHRIGGIWETLSISQGHVQQSGLSRAEIRDLIGLVILAIACVAPIIVAAATPHTLTYLFLAIWGYGSLVWTSTVNERILFQLVTIQDWEIQQKFEYFALYASLPFLTLFIGLRFSKQFHPYIHRSAGIIFSTLAGIVLFTPANVFSHTIFLFQGFVCVYAALWLYNSFGILKEGGKTPKLYFLASVILIATAVNDIVFANMVFFESLINGTFLLPYGAALFLFVACAYQPTTDAQPASSPTLIASPQEKLEQALADYQSSVSLSDKRRLAVASLNVALGSWERSGESKISFAQKSGQWRVSNDDGSLKTRTLDRYLKESSCPQKPRYRYVIKSLDFVCESNRLSAEDVQLLAEAANVLRS